MQKAEALPFLVVEEAIKRSRLALRFQEDLSLIIWERARIEQVYVRNLNEWRDAIRGKLKPIIDKVRDGTDELILDNVARESECTSQIHQNIHSAMMAEDGAYVSLQRGIGLNKIGGSQEERLLIDIEKEFGQMNKKKQNVELEIKKRKSNIDKMNSCIIQYEEQLSKRSRITKLRRSSRGSRKVDILTNRLSMLRKQVEGEKVMVEKKEGSLVDYMTEMKEPMEILYKQLTHAQKQRLELIYKQLKKFASTFNGYSQEYEKRKAEISTMMNAFGSVNIDDMMERIKKDIETKASAKKNGHIYELQEMFSPGHMRNGSSTKKDEFYSHTTLPKQDDQAYMSKYAGNSESDNVLVDTFCASSSESIKPNGRNILVYKSSDSSESSLGSRIETIIIPNEPIINCNMPPPFPIKEFCVSSGEDCSSGAGGNTERDSSARWSITNQQLHHSTVDVGMVRNIKVIATHDFVARKSDQLNFKKGQIIKQKCGENEEGYAYGWIRENRFVPKHYGWYPIGVVQIYTPSSDSSRL